MSHVVNQLTERINAARKLREDYKARTPDYNERASYIDQNYFIAMLEAERARVIQEEDEIQKV